MQKYRLSFSVLAVSMVLTGSSYAYSPKDVAEVTITPGTGWTGVANVLSDDASTTKFEKHTGKTEIETLSKRIEKKPPNANANQLVTQMGDLLTKGLKGKGCETGAPMLEPQTGDNFKVWVQVFQCQQVKLTGLQYYIDADSQNIYLFTYTNNSYPFTKDSRNAAEQEVKALIKVCYNNACSGLQ